ncbi:MAG: fibronectin type III domain-containing protein [Bacteroidales bacterium]|nr:fibronectin type III domain-containing protein [Bacteroidales bacterium]
MEDSTQTDVKWSTYTLSTRIGMNAAADFMGVVRFATSDLTAYAGRYLTSVSFVPGEDQTVCQYSIVVWQGGSVTNDTVFDAGMMLRNQVVNTPLTIDALNTILLDTALLIDVTQELWIGIRCNTTAGYPLGASNNGVVTNKGELLLYQNNWETLTESALTDYNWIIIGNLQEASHILSGYKVYRNDAFLANVNGTSYLDSVDFGGYTYDVTALYASGCESDPITVSVSMNPNPCGECQDSVIVDGTLSTSYLLPLNTFYNYSFSEQIYTSAELGTVNGAINCISFQYIYGTPQAKDIVVYMGNTTKNSFSGNDWVPVNQMFQVFNGTVNFTNAGTDNWVNIPFDVPFEYDGTSNIVVAVLNNTGSYVTSSNPTFNVHTASSKSLYLYNDSNPYNVSSLASGTVGTYRNNMRFLVGDPVTCPMPTYLTVTNVTSDGANISWHANESHNGYELALVPAGSTLENETPITVNDTFYAAAQLTSNTIYTVYVRANCGGGDNSFWNMQTFKTLCEPTAQLPYVMDMEGVGTGSGHIPDCAEVGIGTGYTSYPYVSGTYHHSGSGALYFYAYTPNSSMIRFQGLDLTNNTDPLVMRFWEYKTSAGYGYIQAGYMTDATDFSTFVLVKTVYPSDVPNTATWEEIMFALPESVNGQVIYPTLYCPFAPGSSSNNVYIDDLTIEPGQTTCMAPHNLQFANVAGSSVQVTWTPDATASGTETYHVEYTEAGSDNWQSVTTTASYCLIGGLTPQTQYNVRLYMDCDVDGNSDTLTGVFVTNCLAGGELPIGNGTTTTSYFPTYSCYNYSYTQQIFLANEMNGPTNITSVAFDATSIVSSSRHISIYLMHTTAASSDWLTPTTAQLVYNGTANLVVGWNTFNFFVPFQYNGTDNLAMIIIDSTGSYNCSNSYSCHTASATLSHYQYQDSAPYSITSLPSEGSSGTTSNRANVIFGGNCDSTTVCIAPNVVVTNYSDEEISIAWVPGDQETSWELEYKTADTTDWTSVGTVTTTTYTFTGLTSGTHYDIRLRSVCSGSEYSNWVTVNAFTVCDYIDVPYMEDFESVTGSGSSAFVDCWFRGTNYSTQYPYISTSYAASGNRSLYFYGTSTYYSYAAMPRLDDAVALDSLEVIVKLLATTSGYSIEAGMMTDPSDYSTFVPMATFTVPVGYVWNTYEFTTANYAGNGRYLAFRIPQWGSSYVYLDDLYVDYMAACAHPTDVVLQSATDNEATLGWTPGGDESEWEYTYGPTGTVDLETAVISVAYTNSATLSGLTDNTAYDFYVRTVCTAGGESHWHSISFTTECLPLAVLPYTQNFDSMSTHTSNITSGLNNLSDCWHSSNNGTSYTSYPYVYYSSSYAASGNYSLRFYNYTSTAYDDQYAILPPLDTDTYPINTLQLTFDARRYSTSYPFCVIVGAMTSTDINTFTPIDTVLMNSGGTSYETQVVYLTNYMGTGDRIALMAPKNIGAFVSSAYYNQGHIDNLTLMVAPTCPQPTHLQVDNVTNDAVTLSWQENGSANNWVIEYGTTGFTPGSGTSVQANTNPFTISNLATATAYNFYVKADCGSGDESSYSGPVSATPGSYLMPTSGTNTITTCSMIIYDDGGASGDYSNSCESYLTIMPETAGNLISVQGTVSTESCCDYLRIYDGTSASGTMLGEYKGTGLTVPELVSTTGPLTLHFHSDGSVIYEGFMLTVSCINNSCPAPTGLTVSNVGNTSADVSWTPGGSESSWIVEHKTASATTWTTATVTTPAYQITGLTGLTEYMVRVKADCGGGDESAYKSATFTTPNCAASDACPYTFVLGDGYGDGWNSGYLTVEQGGTVVATLEAVDHNQSSTQTYDTVTLNLCDNISTSLVWHSGSYDDEVSITVIGPDGTQIFTITDPSSATSTTIHTFTTDCSNAPATNPTVATIAATAIAQTSATLNATITNPDNVTITAKGFQWKATQGGTYTQITGTGTGNAFSANLTGLTASTSYTYKAFITFNGQTVYGSEMTFTTLDQGVDPCETPTGLTVSAVTDESITVTWNAAPNVSSWNIQYSAAGGTLSSATSNTNSYTINGLAAGTTYSIQVQANCGDGNLSEWSSAVTGTTTTGIDSWLANSVSLYPNPAKEYVDIRVDGDLNVKAMEVYDVYGKLINTVIVTENPTRINVSGLANGMYFVRVTTEEGMVTKTFVKQ